MGVNCRVGVVVIRVSTKGLVSNTTPSSSLIGLQNQVLINRAPTSVVSAFLLVRSREWGNIFLYPLLEPSKTFSMGSASSRLRRSKGVSSFAAVGFCWGTYGAMKQQA